MFGLAMATGVDANPIQCVYTLILMGAACVCFNAAERKRAASTNQPKQKVYDYASGTFRDAA